jgi:hypothetical protein
MPATATPDQMAEQVRALVGVHEFDIVTSWYSALGHIVSSAVRHQFFAELSGLTRPLGELVVAVAATGDLVDEQAHLKRFMETGGQVAYPCESAQDLLYKTELGQVNFWHVFDVDLSAEMDCITGDGQHFWIRAIRFPDDEFESESDELQNYEKVVQKNLDMADSEWRSEDFEECHTVAARRSSLPWKWQGSGVFRGCPGSQVSPWR